MSHKRAGTSAEWAHRQHSDKGCFSPVQNPLAEIESTHPGSLTTTQTTHRTSSSTETTIAAPRAPAFAEFLLACARYCWGASGGTAHRYAFVGRVRRNDTPQYFCIDPRTPTHLSIRRSINSSIHFRHIIPAGPHWLRQRWGTESRHTSLQSQPSISTNGRQPSHNPNGFPRDGRHPMAASALTGSRRAWSPSANKCF